jgi:hypothetical protein
LRPLEDLVGVDFHLLAGTVEPAIFTKPALFESRMRRPFVDALKAGAEPAGNARIRRPRRQRRWSKTEGFVFV